MGSVPEKPPSEHLKDCTGEMIYTAWGKDGEATLLIEGDKPIRFVDGTSDPETQELIWTIETSSWEEAKKKYYALQGWGEPPRTERLFNSHRATHR